jgi:hypothetical protein
VAEILVSSGRHLLDGAAACPLPNESAVDARGGFSHSEHEIAVRESTPLGSASAASGIWDSERERRAQPQRRPGEVSWGEQVWLEPIRALAARRRLVLTGAGARRTGPGTGTGVCSALTQHESYADCT